MARVKLSGKLQGPPPSQTPHQPLFLVCSGGKKPPRPSLSSKEQVQAVKDQDKSHRTPSYS